MIPVCNYVQDPIDTNPAEKCTGTPLSIRLFLFRGSLVRADQHDVYLCLSLRVWQLCPDLTKWSGAPGWGAGAAQGAAALHRFQLGGVSAPKGARESHCWREGIFIELFKFSFTPINQVNQKTENTDTLLFQKMVTNYSTVVDDLRPKVTELEQEVRLLNGDINRLKQEVGFFFLISIKSL